MRFPSRDPEPPGTAFPLEPFDASFVYPPRRRKFQSRLWLHVVLLLLTIITTTFAGGLYYASFVEASAQRATPWTWGVALSMLLHGFWYSGTFLAILGAHEMGHYLFCRRYDVDATLPYFLPMPFLLTGTLGAVIKIREAFPTRKVLFDIGVAGPIGGFIVLVPALFCGLVMSNLVPQPTSGGAWVFGEPLLFKIASYMVFGTVQQGYTLNAHPMVFAALFGMLATALNLLPFGQLDGGHITYATLGRWSTPVSIATVTAAVAMTFISVSWLVMTLMMLVMLFLLGPRHPRVIYEYESLDLKRNLIAVFAVIMLVLCFTPVPVQFQDLIGRR